MSVMVSYTMEMQPKTEECAQQLVGLATCLQINVTLALGLPSVCNAPANVSQCPALLHLDPNSPEAQVFYQLGRSSNQSDGSPAPSPSGNVTNIHKSSF
ncbi:protein yls3 [Quercus suber]|uniref:Protein yls3 n=1 Tax=Quercus suber TaxID=58331 RepID=A0AAW0JV09_QUESU